MNQEAFALTRSLECCIKNSVIIENVRFYVEFHLLENMTYYKICETEKALTKT